MFEFCSCVVAIGGDVRATVPRPVVSVAEILMLQQIHGGDAVTNIKVSSTEETTSEQERDRLGRLYGDQKVVDLFQQFGELPKTIKEARIASEMLDPVWQAELAKEKKTILSRAKKPKAEAKSEEG